MLGIQPLVVDAVPRLVQDAEERRVEMARIVPRRQSAVAWPDAAAERMYGRVEPTGSEVEADRRRGCLAKDDLPVYRVLPVQDVLARPHGTPGDPVQKRHEFLP